MHLWTLLWILLGLSGSLGPVIYYAWIRHAQAAAQRRAVRALIKRARHIDGTTVAQLEENAVSRLQGEVRPLADELRGPLGGRPCVYWRITASVLRYSERRGRYGARHSYWQQTVDHSVGRPFILADATGECGVDPALAEVSVGRVTKKVFHRGQALPSAIAVMLTEQGVSLDELRGESWQFEETMIAVGAKVVVVGAGRRADRTGAHGERDYRAAQATWVWLDANELELLIADDKRLMRLGPQAEPADLDPRERWQGRTVVAPEASLIPLDEYEANLRSKKRVAVIGVLGALALGATLVFGVLAILRALRTTETPKVLTEAQMSTLGDATQKQRVAAYRSDDAWRDALFARETLRAGDAPCVWSTAVPPGSAIPIVSVTSDGLPQQSARTAAMVRYLEELEASFPKAPPEQYEHLLARATDPPVSPVELVLDLEKNDIATLWLYDHDANKIVCGGQAPRPATVPAAAEPGLLSALHAIADH